MLFPKDKIRHTSVYQGNKSDNGWLILDIGNMELDGVDKIYIDLNDVEGIKSKSKKQSDAVNEMRRLLGGDIDE